MRTYFMPYLFAGLLFMGLTILFAFIVVTQDQGYDSSCNIIKSYIDHPDTDTKGTMYDSFVKEYNARCKQ